MSAGYPCSLCGRRWPSRWCEDCQHGPDRPPQTSLFEPQLDHYRGAAPAVAGDEASEEAASLVARPGNQSLVFDCVQQAGQAGIVCGEVEEATGLVHQNASARLRELSQDPGSPIWKTKPLRVYAGSGRRQHVYYEASIARRLAAGGHIERAPLREENECPACGHTW